MNGEITTVLMLVISIVNVHSKLLNVMDLGLVKILKKPLSNYLNNMMTIMMVLSILMILSKLIT